MDEDVDGTNKLEARQQQPNHQTYFHQNGIIFEKCCFLSDNLWSTWMQMDKLVRAFFPLSMSTHGQNKGEISDIEIWKYLRLYILSAAHVNASTLLPWRVQVIEWTTTQEPKHESGESHGRTEKKERNASKIKCFSFIRLGFPASTSATPHTYSYRDRRNRCKTEKKTSQTIHGHCAKAYSMGSMPMSKEWHCLFG